MAHLPLLLAAASALADTLSRIPNLDWIAAQPGFRMRVVDRYELPESLGTRTMVEISATPKS